MRAILDSFPGSERVLSIADAGRIVGSAPRMFGKQISIALGADRLYIGTAERLEILTVDLETLVIDTIALPWPEVPLSAEDIALQKAVQIAASPPNRRRGIEQDLADHPFPEVLPHCRSLRLDVEGMLWVQDYPRASMSRVRWTVISPDGTVLAHAELPTHLEVFEIGTDYVLGRYVDPVEAILQVRMYGLTRH